MDSFGNSVQRISDNDELAPDPDLDDLPDEPREAARSLAAPTLARLEAELAMTFQERSADLAHFVARALVELAAEEHAARNGNGRPAGPKLCGSCRMRLAARHRTICDSCRGRLRRQREQFRSRQAHERLAAANGKRGPRAKELALGLRADPAATPLTVESLAP
jgi:hypothetical protein